MSMATSWSLDDILDMDIDTFNELFSSMIRVEYNEKTERAWTTMIASQGRQKDMKKWVGGWRKLTGGGTATKGQNANDLGGFLELFSGGF